MLAEQMFGAGDICRHSYPCLFDEYLTLRVSGLYNGIFKRNAQILIHRQGLKSMSPQKPAKRKDSTNSACNFAASNVLEYTTHFKISTRDDIKLKISQIPIMKSLGWSLIKLFNSRNILDGSRKKTRVWPESNLHDFNPETLNLQTGELVQIRSKEEIFATLNENGKYKGLLFMPEMVKFCGQRHKVFKNVKKIELESTLEMRELKSPTVFLEGLFCDGEFHNGCDRSCFLYWKEAWLKRVNP